jgi:hypothetical protein
MRKSLMMLLTFWSVLLIPVSVQAQGKLHFSSMSVDIWPEYDRPAVLMIYRLTLAPETNLPAILSLRIPLGAEINAVAVADATGNLINVPYDKTTQGQWVALNITLTSLQVQVEYYTALVKNGTTRHIVFDWAGDYPVERMEVNFLRPAGAESPTFSLRPDDTSLGQDGLTNYRIKAVNLMTDKPFVVSIDYERKTDALSISSLPIQAASTPGPDTPGHVSMTGILPWVLVGIGLLLIIAGIVGFVSWQRGGQVSAAIKHRTPRLKESEKDYIFCHQCGRRAQPGDVFCRTCGTRLKTGSKD